MYLGAGRGPLLFRAIKAAQEAGVKINLVAVEKNLNAVNALRNMLIDKNLLGTVTLYSGDMR